MQVLQVREKERRLEVLLAPFHLNLSLNLLVVAGLFWMQQAESEGPRQSFMSSDHLWHTLGNSPA